MSGEPTHTTSKEMVPRAPATNYCLKRYPLQADFFKGGFHSGIEDQRKSSPADNR